jgi:hypothetical protein
MKISHLVLNKMSESTSANIDYRDASRDAIIQPANTNNISHTNLSVVNPLMTINTIVP